MSIAAIIPAFCPGQSLVNLVVRLCDSALDPILIVDDGSGTAFNPIFEQCRLLPKVLVLEHADNQGKGAALKTGMRYVLAALPDCEGVVTADADGQHHPDDVVKVATRLTAQPSALVLGVREFGPAVPRRNRVGNLITRALLRALLGRNLQDAQTGLRGISRAILPPLTEITSNGYEFELDMLMASKHWHCPIVEVRIRTIYQTDSYVSHFRPLLDSMRVALVLLRYAMLSLMTAVVDNVVFWGLLQTGAGILRSQVGGRIVAVLFNYAAARRAVFLSRERHLKLMPKYLLLVAASGFVSYQLINLLHSTFGMGVMWAKILAETALFFVNFLVQRDYVFTRPASQETPDRDSHNRGGQELPDDERH